MLSRMTIRQKAQQTAVLRIPKDRFVSDQVGAAFFFGEIITEASDIGLDNGRRLLERYSANAEIPMLLTSDFENGCGSSACLTVPACVRFLRRTGISCWMCSGAQPIGR